MAAMRISDPKFLVFADRIVSRELVSLEEAAQGQQEDRRY